MVSEDVIIKLVTTILDESFINNYQFYLLLASIIFVSVTISSFLTSYMKQRGKSYATKADFDEITEQLRETTTLTEKIRSDIAAEFQEQNTLKHLTREKIENIIDQTYKIELWLEQARTNAFNSKLPDTNDSPISKIEMYQTIYFRKTEMQMLTLHQSYLPMINFIFDLATQAKNKQPFEVEPFKELQSVFVKNLKDFRQSILTHYATKNGL